MDSIWIKSLRQGGEHSYHRRAISHDYYSPFIYHIILKKTKGCESFGSVDGDARIAPGNPGCAYIKESELGEVIAKSILHFPHEYPIIKLHQFCVMPDHVHILLQVLYRADRHLDFYIDSLRKMIAGRYSKLRAGVIDDMQIFEAGYCDKPLYDNRDLDALYRYIRENPHRLAMRRQYPQFFTRLRKLKIKDKEFEAYGNLFLIRNPDKMPVKISSKYSDEEKANHKAACLSGVSKGTVLVSPFISKAEKGIRAAAEALGARIILITHERLPERFKPAARDFSLCTQGNLLIISLGLPEGSELTRSVCLQMNALAVWLSR